MTFFLELLIASGNAGKIKEIRGILAPVFKTVRSAADAGIRVDVEETGATFEENARIKAEAILSAARTDAVLADDSGLCVDALSGAPGVLSARFSGGGDAENNQKLLRLLAGVPQGARGARFVCCAALARAGKETICACGACAGEILFAGRGAGGFGYDPLFYYPPMQKTFAELSAAEKNQISHRKLALTALLARLLSESGT